MRSQAKAVNMPLKNILVATDFSLVSLSALTRVLPIARRFHSVIHIFYVIHQPDMALAAINWEVDRQVHDKAQQALCGLESVVGSIPHRTWLRRGELWANLKDIVQSQHIDLISVGASGKSNFKKLLLGSAAEEILRSATCPVLTAGPHVSSSVESVNQLLYVTNLLEESHHGLQYAIWLAAVFNCQLLLLHVIEQEEPKDSNHDWLQEYRRMLQRLLPDAAGNLPVEPVLRIEATRNCPARILRVADEIAADLIIMDVRPEEPWATHLHDKVYEIISDANCPVLTARTSIEPASSVEDVLTDGQCVL